MNETHSHRPAGLPAELDQALTATVADLRQRLGATLQGVILYGSAARGLYDPARSDLNLLIVLTNSPPASLSVLADTLGRLADQARVAPYIVDQHELTWVARLFPTRLMEMKRGYCVLAGADVLAPLAADPAAIIQRVQAELLNALLRLRNLLATTTTPEGHEAAARLVFAPYLKTLRMLVHLRTGEQLDDRPALVARAAELFALDPTPLRQLLQWRAGRIVFQGSEWPELTAGLLEAIAGTARHCHE